MHLIARGGKRVRQDKHSEYLEWNRQWSPTGGFSQTSVLETTSWEETELQTRKYSCLRIGGLKLFVWGFFFLFFLRGCCMLRGVEQTGNLHHPGVNAVIERLREREFFIRGQLSIKELFPERKQIEKHTDGRGRQGDKYTHFSIVQSVLHSHSDCAESRLSGLKICCFYRKKNVYFGSWWGSFI